MCIFCKVIREGANQKLLSSGLIKESQSSVVLELILSWLNVAFTGLYENPDFWFYDLYFLLLIKYGLLGCKLGRQRRGFFKETLLCLFICSCLLWKLHNVQRFFTIFNFTSWIEILYTGWIKSHLHPLNFIYLSINLHLVYGIVHKNWLQILF